VMESVDALDFIESWVAPEERHRSRSSSLAGHKII
jgi:hypothetical protein